MSPCRVSPPSSRRYRADRQFQVKRLDSKFSTDAFYFKRKILTGNIGCQIYSHCSGFNVVYPMPNTKGETIGNTLKSFISEYGAPESLTFDGARVQVGRNTSFQKTLRKFQIQQYTSAPYRPNENPAEGSIREVKKRWYRLQAKKDVPDRLIDFGIQ